MFIHARWLAQRSKRARISYKLCKYYSTTFEKELLKYFYLWIIGILLSFFATLCLLFWPFLAHQCFICIPTLASLANPAATLGISKLWLLWYNSGSFVSWLWIISAVLCGRWNLNQTKSDIRQSRLCKFVIILVGDVAWFLLLQCDLFLTALRDVTFFDNTYRRTCDYSGMNLQLKAMEKYTFSLPCCMWKQFSFFVRPVNI